MKKKLLCILLATSCAFSLMACKDKEEKKDKADKDDKEPVQEEEAPVEDTKVGPSEYLLTSDYIDDVICSVDDEGNKLGEYKYDQIMDYIEDAGYDSEVAYVSGSLNGVVLLNYCEYFDDGDADYYLLAVDTKTGKVASLKDCYEEMGYPSPYTYNGKIYCTNYDYDSHVYTEVAIEMKDGLEFSSIEDETFVVDGYNPISTADGRPNLVNRMFDEYGFALVETTGGIDRYYTLTEDGKVEKIEALDRIDLLSEAYNDKYFVYELYNSDLHAEDEYYAFDFSTNESTKLDLPGENMRIVGLKDNILYYQDGPLYDDTNISDYHIYAYDLENNKQEELYTVTPIPGVNSVQSYTKMYGDSLMIADLDGAELKWYKLGDDGSKNDIDCPIRTYNAYKYGTVTYDSNEYDCPDCGTALYKVYDEAFVLDSKYSDYADTINATLKEKLDNNMNITPDYYESDCRDHLEDPQMYCETDDRQVKDVRIINDKFLVVDMSGYWYGGGAHGMPYRDEYIFDLTTGEELTFKDFYKGTEDELKALVAEKAKEDFEQREADGNYVYFASSAQDLYDTVYEYTSIDTGNVYFNEDCVIYYFYPYDLASYADGFREFSFTYQEMFGTDKMTR